MSCSSLFLALAVLPHVPVTVPQPVPENATRSRPDNAPEDKTRNVAIVLYDGVELLDFAGPAEVFKAASGFGGGKSPAFRVYTVAATKAPLKSLGFVTITPQYSVEDAPKPDIIVIPGGMTDSFTSNPKALEWARTAMAEAEITMTVCTGAFVPARVGMLDGLVATTWYGAIADLREAAPKANVQEGRRFVDNGKIVTTAGVSAGIDGALHLVARLLGRAAADRTAIYMEYHWTPEPYLAQRYTHLDTGLDDAGRAMQQASALDDAHDWPAAAKAWRAIADREPTNGVAWYRLGSALAWMKKYDESVSALTKASEFTDVRANALYNLACVHALEGRSEDAIATLTSAVEAGFHHKHYFEQDADLASIRQDPRFQKLLEEM